jgi:hypothetical protein
LPGLWMLLHRPLLILRRMRFHFSHIGEQMTASCFKKDQIFAINPQKLNNRRNVE